MSNNLEHVMLDENRMLKRALLLAMLVYIFFAAGVLFLVHVRFHARSASESAPILQAELLDRHELAKLYEVKPKASAQVKSEKTISKQLSTSKTPSAAAKQDLPEQNQTLKGAPPIATHGPIVESSVTPKLPEYLKNQNLKASVLIEFFVTAAGVTTPALVSSSGNAEVDALALKAAQSWIFGPAMKDGKAVDSKVRLRINFEVD